MISCVWTVELRASLVRVSAENCLGFCLFALRRAVGFLVASRLLLGVAFDCDVTSFWRGGVGSQKIKLSFCVSVLNGSEAGFRFGSGVSWASSSLDSKLETDVRYDVDFSLVRSDLNSSFNRSIS